MHKESQRKTEMQHTSVVLYSGSCTKKHDELTDTSLQVLYNAKIFGFMYRHSILGWYSEPYDNE